MSLATRCTACHTTFRVVQDQLKVSDGWVRCGRCNEVFNAMEGLFDLQRETTPNRSSRSTGGDTGSPPLAAPTASTPLRESRESSRSAPPPARPSPAPAPAPSYASSETEDDDAGLAKVMHEMAAQEQGRIARSQSRVPPPAPNQSMRRPREEWPDAEDENVSVLPSENLHPAFADAAFPEDVDDETYNATGPAPLESETTHRSSRGRSSSRSSRSSSKSRSSRSSRKSKNSRDPRLPPEPGFVRKAVEEEWWSQPQVRAALVMGLLALGAVLMLQIGYHWRDRVAAQYPQFRP